MVKSIIVSLLMISLLASCKSSGGSMCPAYQSTLPPKERKKYEERLKAGKINSRGESKRRTEGESGDLFGRRGPKQKSRMR